MKNVPTNTASILNVNGVCFISVSGRELRDATWYATLNCLMEKLINLLFIFCVSCLLAGGQPVSQSSLAAPRQLPP
jgi:hypothetical protein